jgi:hypothetical protein
MKYDYQLTPLHRLRLLRIGRAGSSHATGNMSILAVTIAVGKRVKGECIGHALARREKWCSRGSARIWAEWVHACILAVVILNTMLVIPNIYV